MAKQTQKKPQTVDADVEVYVEIKQSNAGQQPPSLQELALRGLANQGFFKDVPGPYGATLLALREQPQIKQFAVIFIKKEEALKKLLQHIVQGEQDDAEQLIKMTPSLLLEKGETKDYSGRTIIGTAYQAALGAEDGHMYKMMKPYFKKLEKKRLIHSAKETMKQQFDEQFPNGIEDTPASELQPLYNDLATAIANNSNNGDAAIVAFRKKITERKIITNGKHFNMQYLIAAYQAYIDNFVNLKTWDNRNKFWCKVIGYVQRQMPVNYAQTYCSGIKNVLDSADKFKRTLDMRNANNFFPLDTAKNNRLGYDFAVYIHPYLPYYIYPIKQSVRPEHKGGLVVDALCSTKTAELNKLRSSFVSNPECMLL